MPSRVSISSAWPSSAISEAAWSMPPVVAPTTSFSARTQARASSRRPSGLSPSPSPFRSSTASAVAHSNAADDDSPAPNGTVSTTARSSPATLVPGLPQRPEHPGRVPGPALGCAGADPVQLDLDDVRLGDAAHPHPPVGARGRFDHRALGDREGQAQPVGVVDVLPDEVDPPRRRPAADRRCSRTGRPQPVGDLLRRHVVDPRSRCPTRTRRGTSACPAPGAARTAAGAGG